MPRYSLETIILILLILWLLGAFIVPFGGGLVHLILVIVLVVRSSSGYFRDGYALRAAGP